VQIAFKSIRLDCIIQGRPTTQRVTAEGGGDIKPLRVAGKGLATPHGVAHDPGATGVSLLQ